ncbi:hypothetical protein KIN20_026023 [Parelaphostrongylus tenuis]|uniref:Uncharacterized protein n=1 Tax=Parelaphostrongylus tenuis TaxID=148309 RepID=A0AAD5QX96_PARTN|nr:hypothetical protein KIN20_026023 [Parelaphostrongylus tenuis]
MMFTSHLLVVLLSAVVSKVTPRSTTTDGTEGEVSTTDYDYLNSTPADESDKLCGKEGEEWKEEHFQRYTLEFHNGRLRAPRNLSLLRKKSGGKTCASDANSKKAHPGATRHFQLLSDVEVLPITYHYWDNSNIIPPLEAEYSCDLEKLADQAVDGCSTKSPQDVPDYYTLFKH